MTRGDPPHLRHTAALTPPPGYVYDFALFVQAIRRGTWIMNNKMISLAVTAVALALSHGALALDAGQPVPNCPMKTWEGAALDLAQHRGKVVYLDFWASWCVPCAQSFPLMNKLHKELGPKGLEIIAVNLDENEADAKDFLAKHPADFMLGRDSGECANVYGVQGMPFTYLVDREGRISHVHRGFSSDEEGDIRARIEGLLDGKLARK
jgi:thiol-disulfide isomerase/thioredoxin